MNDSLNDLSLDSIVLKSLVLTDLDGDTHYYIAGPQEIERYKFWKNLFDQTYGKELSWAQFYGMDPITGYENGFYNVVGSGLSYIVQVNKGEIVAREGFGSGEGFLFSHIERYYEETKEEPPNPDGTVRIESAEIY